MAFAISLKHRLRFEPYTSIYDDLGGFVDHLETFANVATEADKPRISTPGSVRLFGQYLGLPFAESNPMHTINSSDMPLGNLPLEVLTYIGAFLDYMVENGQLKVPMQQTVACKFVLKAFFGFISQTDLLAQTTSSTTFTMYSRAAIESYTHHFR